MEKFEEFMLSDKTMEALNKIEITEPTEIQVMAIPFLLQGRDVIGQAQTGTGKTFAYSIPLVEMIKDTDPFACALVLCPTRELTIQVSVEMKKLLAFRHDIKIATVYGGESYEKQFKALREKPQIIIGTPGRIIDHLNRGTLNFNNLRHLILDEADEMLKMGFQDDLEEILKNAPKERQTALFSATMPPFIKKIALSYQNNPEHIIVQHKTLTVEKITQKLFFVKKENKKDLLIRILDLYDFKSAMIFCNTKSMVDELVVFLQKMKYQVDGLHGDLKQMVRDRVMNAFRSGSIKVLVATDVAARGIDVTGIEAIVNYDIPSEDELYVHRIGRTGRAGEDGLSLSFASPREQYRIRQIEKYTNSKITEEEIPSIDVIKTNYMNKLYKKVIARMDESKNTNYDSIIEKFKTDGYESEDIIRALIDIVGAKTERNYNEIEPVRVARHDDSRNSRDGKSRSNYKDGSRGGRDSYKGDRSQSRRSDGAKQSYDVKDKDKKRMVTVKVNLGKADSIRPQAIVNLCNKVASVHKEHIGDITIEDNYTFIKVASEGVRYMEGLNGKTYNNKKIKVFID